MTIQDRFFATVIDEAFALLVLENYMGCMGKYGSNRILFQKSCAMADNITEEIAI